MLIKELWGRRPLLGHPPSGPGHLRTARSPGAIGLDKATGLHRAESRATCRMMEEDSQLASVALQPGWVDFLSPVPAVLSGLGSGQISWEIAFAFVCKVKLAS